MTRTDAKLLAGLWIFVLAVFLVFLGCGGGGRKSPRQPTAPTIPVTTPWGSLSVQWSCPGQTFDRSRVEADVARAYLKGEQQDSRVAGLSLTGTWALFGAETDPERNGHHEWLGSGGSRIYLRCPPAASALSHELAHRFGHQLGLRCDSSPGGGLDLIDHPGGFDLRCGRLAALGYGRGCHGAFRRPASVEAIVNRARTNAESPCPPGNGVGYPLYFNESVTPRVRCLLDERCPSAVFRSVPFVVVNAVYGMPSGRPRPHVSQENCEALPSFTYCNPPASIPVEPLIVGVGAALPHVSPRHVFGSGVPRYTTWTVSATSAAAASRRPRFQVVPSDETLCPANTAAQYPRSLFCDHRPRTVAHSGSIPRTVTEFAHQLRVHCDLSPDGGLHLIDHPGGFDLRCRRLP